MHAVLITFEFLDDFNEAAFDRFAGMLREVDGLASTTWMHDRSTVGLFQLFTSTEQADRYLSSPAIVRLASHPSCTDFYVERFDTVDTLSRRSTREVVPVYA